MSRHCKNLACSEVPEDDTYFVSKRVWQLQVLIVAVWTFSAFNLYMYIIAGLCAILQKTMFKLPKSLVVDAETVKVVPLAHFPHSTVHVLRKM
jgi:hypothetical protein